jgi:hypothetical protein
MAIILAFLSALTACQHHGNVGRWDALESKNSIVGRWEALEPKNGLVNILAFQADGKSLSSLLVRGYTRYHIEGDKLILVPDNSSEIIEPTMQSDVVMKPVEEGKKTAGKQTGEKQTETKQDEQSKLSDPGIEPIVYTFMLKNDRLTLTNDKTGEAVEMQREGQAIAPDSIVGQWSYQYNMVPARRIFGANGINLNTSPVPAAMGTEGYYEVKGDVLTVTSPDKKNSQSVHFKLENGILVVNDGRKIVHYVRMSESN